MHEFTGIYIVYSSTISRTLRYMLYFLRLFLALAILSNFIEGNLIRMMDKIYVGGLCVGFMAGCFLIQMILRMVYEKI